MSDAAYAKNLALYEKLVATNPRVKRQGATVRSRGRGIRSIKRGLAALAFALAGLFAVVSAVAQTPAPAPTPNPASVSPDKQWQYVAGEKRKLVKAGTTEAAVEFDCNADEPSAVLWAPDSTRFAITCAGGKGKWVSVFQLRDGKWETPDEELGNGDDLMNRAGKIIERQSKKKMPKNTFLHMNRWSVEAEKWVDARTLVVYAEMWEVAHRRDGSYADASFGADVLFTLRFDDSGAWKIVKTHEMSEKEVKQREAKAH